jgi:uncharacterized RDD family membrane protein YckC
MPVTASTAVCFTSGLLPLSLNMECPHCHSQISSSATHCKRCGGVIPSGQYLLEECGLAEPARSSGIPASAADPARKPASYRFARLGDRFLAFALDTALLFGLFAVVDAWIYMRLGTFDGSELQLTTAALVIAMALNAIILFLYGWLLEAACGATLGKALVGIRIVRTAQQGSLKASAVRNALRIVDGLGFYLVGAVVAACSSVRQRIGDICARTAVVEQSFGIGIRVAGVLLWIATLAGAWWAVPRICSVNDPIHTRYFGQVIVRVGRTGNSAYFKIAGFTIELHTPTAS